MRFGHKAEMDVKFGKKEGSWMQSIAQKQPSVTSYK